MGAHAVRLSNVDIDAALDARDFEIQFQPIYDLRDGSLARMETFVRWRHRTLGLLPPGAFISFFETQGRMSELTRYVLHEALDAYTDWRGPFGPGFSINLALSDIVDSAFAAHFEVTMRDRGFPTEFITFECPMPPVDADPSVASASYGRLAATGARLAIEVRGRANDFLKSVDPFPFDEIKTGGAAILRFARTVRGPGLSAISELLELAADRNATITAVGVEDQASLVALRGIGFGAAQGNHLGRVGDLKRFTPSCVNDVRSLIGLTPLDGDALAKLFRSPAPSSIENTLTEKQATMEQADDVAIQRPDAHELRRAALREVARRRAAAIATADGGNGDDLIDRLSARIAREIGDPDGDLDLEAAAVRKAAGLARGARRHPPQAKEPEMPEAESAESAGSGRGRREELESAAVTKETALAKRRRSARAARKRAAVEREHAAEGDALNIASPAVDDRNVATSNAKTDADGTAAPAAQAAPPEPKVPVAIEGSAVAAKPGTEDYEPAARAESMAEEITAIAPDEFSDAPRTPESDDEECPDEAIYVLDDQGPPSGSPAGDGAAGDARNEEAREDAGAVALADSDDQQQRDESSTAGVATEPVEDDPVAEAVRPEVDEGEVDEDEPSMNLAAPAGRAAEDVEATPEPPESNVDLPLIGKLAVGAASARFRPGVRVMTAIGHDGPPETTPAAVPFTEDPDVPSGEAAAATASWPWSDTPAKRSSTKVDGDAGDLQLDDDGRPTDRADASTDDQLIADEGRQVDEAETGTVLGEFDKTVEDNSGVEKPDHADFIGAYEDHRDEAAAATKAVDVDIPTEGMREVDEEVALARRLRPLQQPPKSRNFFTRTVIPFRVLRITHFWPKWAKGSTRRADDAATRRSNAVD
ncbi:MAG: EAL domain-containing protein [Alphaproteobacteria bacterium]|nr:EAL domain-containing protein [Alphaproteobacteria bacterium]